MRPVPISPPMLRHYPEHATTLVLSGPTGDLVDDPIRPVEVIRYIDNLAGGGPAVATVVMLRVETGDLEKLADGGHVALTLWGPCIHPFAVEVVDP